MAKRTVKLTEDALVYVPEIPFTDTWSPVHHKDVVASLRTSLDDLGIKPVSTRYETSTNGMNLFGTWTLPGEGRDALSIGFRNSMQKDFSLGLVGGHNVLVCSNMAFWGEFVEHRRHTAGLTPEALKCFISKAAQKTLDQAAGMRQWFLGLHEEWMPPTLFKQLTYDAIDIGIIPPSRFVQFQTAFNEELQANRYPDLTSLAHFHGAVTRLLRGSSVRVLQEKTLALNGLINSVRVAQGDEIDVESTEASAQNLLIG
jgi:hypothetical protein